MNAAKADAEKLMNAALPIAEELLTKHREFFPFGGVKLASGEIIHVSGWKGDEQPPSNEIIELLESAFREGAIAGKYKATALVFDVIIIPPGKTEKQDAIAIVLDHQDNYSVRVLFPYSFQEDGQLNVEPAIASENKRKVFLD